MLIPRKKELKNIILASLIVNDIFSGENPGAISLISQGAKIIKIKQIIIKETPIKLRILLAKYQALFLSF